MAPTSPEYSPRARVAFRTPSYSPRASMAPTSPEYSPRAIVASTSPTHSPRPRSPAGSDGSIDPSDPFTNSALMAPELREGGSFANLQDELADAMRDDGSVDDTSSEEEEESEEEREEEEQEEEVKDSEEEENEEEEQEEQAEDDTARLFIAPPKLFTVPLPSLTLQIPTSPPIYPPSPGLMGSRSWALHPDSSLKISQEAEIASLNTAIEHKANLSREERDELRRQMDRLCMRREAAPFKCDTLHFAIVHGYCGGEGKVRTGLPNEADWCGCEDPKEAEEEVRRRVERRWEEVCAEGGPSSEGAAEEEEEEKEEGASNDGSRSYISGSDHLDVKGKGKAINDDRSYASGSDHLDIKGKDTTTSPAVEDEENIFPLLSPTSPTRMIFDPLHLLNHDANRDTTLPIKHVKVQTPTIVHPSRSSSAASQVASLHDPFADDAVHLQEGAVRSVEFVHPEANFPESYAAVIEDPFDDRHSSESETIAIPPAAAFSEPTAPTEALQEPAESIPLQPLSHSRPSLDSIDLDLDLPELTNIPIPSLTSLEEHRSEAENYLAQARQVAGLNSHTGSPIDLEAGSAVVVLPWYRRKWAYLWVLGLICCAVLLGVLIAVVVERMK